MHTYRKSRDENTWTVGYWSNEGNWVPLSDHPSAKLAREEVNYLNGGNSVVTTYVETP